MLTKAEVSAVTVGLLGIAPGGFTSDLEQAFNTKKELADFLMNTGVFKSMYGENLSNEEFTIKFMQKMLGDTLPQESFDSIVADFTAVLDAGGPRGQFVENAVTVIQTITNDDLQAARTIFNEKLAYAEAYNGNSENLDDLAGVLKGETPTEPTEPGTPGDTLKLTEGRDFITPTSEGVASTDGDDTFVGLVGQNDKGAISNAFATGDYIDGGAGVDKIEATLINDNQVDSGADMAINARTVNVEQAFFEVLEEGVNVDAGRMDSVEQFWSDNSDKDLIIDDVRLGSKLGITKDITFGLRDVDTEAGLYAAFDTNSLRNAGTNTSDSQLLIRIADVSTETPNTPLANVNMQLSFQLGDQTIELTNLQSTDGSYAGLVSALKTALAAKGLTGVEVSLGEAYNQVTFAGNTVNLPFTANQILLKDPNGEAFGDVKFEQSAIDPVTGGFLVAGNAEPFDPTQSSTLIETNVILDNAGRGSTAGDVIIGGMSNSDVAIQKLNLRVDQSSKVQDVTSVIEAHNSAKTTLEAADFNNRVAFEQIVVTSGAAKGDLSIGNIENTKLFDATAFEGANLSVGGAIDSAEYGAYSYNTAASNDTVNIKVDSETSASSNFALSINTAGGNDNVIVSEDGGAQTASQFGDHAELMNININTGAGDDVVLAEGYGAAQISTGTGNDYINTDNSGIDALKATAASDFGEIFLVNGNASVTGANVPGLPTSVDGLGNTTYNMFKTKVQVEFMGIKSGWVEISSTDFQSTARDINNAIKQAISEDTELKHLLVAQDVRNEGLALKSTIDRALDSGDFQLNFLAPRLGDETNANRATATASTANQDLDNYVDDAAQLTVSDSELQSAWEKYTGSTWGGGSDGFGGGSTSTDFDAVLKGDAENGIIQIVNDLNDAGGAYESTADRNIQDGTNSTENTQNIVNAGEGDDLIVLSSNATGLATGHDTVVFEGNFGFDTIVNFNTDTAAPGTTARDVLDFTSYLDEAANNRGNSANSNAKTVDQQVKYSFNDRTGSDLTVSATDGDFGYHNSVMQVDLEQVWGELAATDAANPTAFYDITAEQLKRALDTANNGVTLGNQNEDGMKSVLMLVQDREITRDAAGNPSLAAADLASPEHALIFTVTTNVAADGKVTFTVEKKGGFQLAQAFSNLHDIEADSILGTPEYITEEANLASALTDGTKPVNYNSIAAAEAATDRPDVYTISDTLNAALLEARGDVVADKAVLAGAKTLTLTDVNSETVTFDNLTIDKAATTIDFTDNEATLTATQLDTITDAAGANLSLTAGDAITVTGVAAANVLTVDGALSDNDTIELSDDQTLNVATTGGDITITDLNNLKATLAADSTNAGTADANVTIALADGETLSKGTGLVDTIDAGLSAGESATITGTALATGDVLDLGVAGINAFSDGTNNGAIEITATLSGSDTVFSVETAQNGTDTADYTITVTGVDLTAATIADGAITIA